MGPLLSTPRLAPGLVDQASGSLSNIAKVLCTKEIHHVSGHARRARSRTSAGAAERRTTEEHPQELAADRPRGPDPAHPAPGTVTPFRRTGHPRGGGRIDRSRSGVPRLRRIRLPPEACPLAGPCPCGRGGWGPRVGPVSALPAADHPDPRSAAIRALTDPALRDIVDLVLWVEDDDGRRVACAASSLGRVRLHPGGVHEVLEGIDPVASEDPMAFLPYDREVAAPGPRSSSTNAYPYAARADPVAVRRPDPQPRPRRRAHPAALVPRRGGPRRGARLARRHPVPGTARPERRRGAAARRRRQPRQARGRGSHPRDDGRRGRGRAARRAGRCAGRCPAHVVPAGRGCPCAAAGGGHPVGRRPLR